MSKSYLTVVICRNSDRCESSTNQCEQFKLQLKQRYGQIPLPAKLKVGIAGCKRCCTMPKVRDLGIILTEDGWEIHFGGNGGYTPRIADKLADHLSDDEALAFIEKLLSVYVSHAPEKMRSSRFMEKIGTQKLAELMALGNISSRES